MANGFCPSLLSTLSALQGTDHARKLTTNGFVQMLNCCQTPADLINDLAYANGHQRGLSLSYMPRVSTGAVSEEEVGCDTAISRVKQEYTIPDLMYSGISEWISDETISKFCQEASECITINPVNNAPCFVGDVPRTVLEVYRRIIDLAGAVIGNMNDQLTAEMSTQFGTNVTTGANTAKAMSIATSDNAMIGMAMSILDETRQNQFCGDFCVVGNGPFTSAEMIRAFANCCTDAGLDANAVWANFPRIYLDNSTKINWGANQIGVFDRGSVKLISYNKYVGTFAKNFGQTMKFTMALPMSEFACAPDCLDNMLFDVTLRYIDCPQTIELNGYQTSVQEGWIMTVEKRYGLFVQPTGLFNADDELAGTNGTLRYTITKAS